MTHRTPRLSEPFAPDEDCTLWRLAEWEADTEALIVSGRSDLKWDDVQNSVPEVPMGRFSPVIGAAWWSAVRRIKGLLYDPAKAKP